MQQLKFSKVKNCCSFIDIWGVLWLHIEETPERHHAVHHSEDLLWHRSIVTGLGLISALFQTVKKCQWLKNIFGTTCNGSHMAKGKVQEKVIAISKSLGKNLWVGGKEQKCKVNGKRFRCSFYCQWKNGSSFAYLCSYIICISHANPALQCRTVSNFKAYNLLGC